MEDRKVTMVVAVTRHYTSIDEDGNRRLAKSVKLEIQRVSSNTWLGLMSGDRFPIIEHEDCLIEVLLAWADIGVSSIMLFDRWNDKGRDFEMMEGML